MMVFFASLAVLPGCQHLFPPSRLVSEETRMRQHQLAQKEAASRSESSIAQASTTPTHQTANHAPLAPASMTPALPDIPAIDASRLKPWKGDLVTPVKHEPAAEFGNAPQTLVQATLPPQLPNRRTYAPSVEAFQDFLDGQFPEAIKHLEAYDKETQEFFIRLLPPLAIFAKKGVGELNVTEINKINDQLMGTLAMLRPRSELTISKACFCKKVYEFASYVPLPANHAFLAGTPDRLGELVQLYVELKNFGSEPADDATFLTKLACTLEVRDVAGKVYWSHTYPRQGTTHRRHSRLNDFYSNFSFYVPPLAPGAYRLAIRIADESNPDRPRTVSETLDFRVTPIQGQTTPR